MQPAQHRSRHQKHLMPAGASQFVWFTTNRDKIVVIVYASQAHSCSRLGPDPDAPRPAIPLWSDQNQTTVKIENFPMHMRVKLDARTRPSWIDCIG